MGDAEPESTNPGSPGGSRKKPIDEIQDMDKTDIMARILTEEAVEDETQM